MIYCGLYCFAYLRKLLENIIATPNLFAIFSYDYLIWARSNFIRFCIPVLPFVFFALLRVLPKNRWVLWGLCVVSAVLAAASAVGVRNAIATVP